MVKKLFLLFLMVFALSFAFACNETKDDDKQNEETKEYTVTFVVDGEKTEVKVKDGEKATKPIDPEKEGYTFLGWYVGDDAYDFEKAVTKDVKLVAKFEEVPSDEPGDEPSDDPVEEPSNAPEEPNNKSEEKSGCGSAASILFLSFALLGLCIIKKKQ